LLNYVGAGDYDIHLVDKPGLHTATATGKRRLCVTKTTSDAPND
jgi:hypothetical protein